MTELGDQELLDREANSWEVTILKKNYRTGKGQIGERFSVNSCLLIRLIAL